MKLYRFESDNLGIYEAVDRDCPRDDARRMDKPDGSWLPKVGHQYPGAVSYWTQEGLTKYISSGLCHWHNRVTHGKKLVTHASLRGKPLYSDTLQVIAQPSEFLTAARVETTEFVPQFFKERLLTLRRGLRDNADAEKVIQTVLEAAPRYSINTEGDLPSATSGKETLDAIPPDCQFNQKYVFIVECGGTPCGVIEYIDGYPNAETGFLGLLLLEEKFQGLGFGETVYRTLEEWARKSTKNRKIRLSVVDNNPVVPFSEKMGFRMTSDEPRIHEGAKLKSLKRIMEKIL